MSSETSETQVGNYVIEGIIGRGGMGVVYRGRHVTLPRKVAVKSIAPRGQRDLHSLRKRLEREAFIQSQLDHPAIVKVYDYIVSEQAYFIVMELVRGRSLAQLLAQEASPLPVERALDIFEQILGAVAYAHTFTYRDEHGAEHHGIIHRDLKPPNILVAPDDRIKITDFGIVKLVGAENTETSGVAYGSPRYVSPEQAGGDEVGQRSDIYSLGIILYEMLTGSTPFGGKDDPRTRTEILLAHIERTPRAPSSINPSVAPEVEQVVCRALEKKPERRFASVHDFHLAVRRARGRDASDLTSQAAHVGATSARRVGTEELFDVAEHVLRETFNTQPIADETCAVCGAGNGADDEHCRECGHELDASPATAQLSRREIFTRARAGRWWMGAALLLLVALGGMAGLFYVWDKPEVDASPQRLATPDVLAASPSATPVSSSALVALAPARVRVDSNFSGYNEKPLTDGIVDVRQIAAARYNRGNWASAETPEPHWIELEFERPARVAAVYIYWGYDRDRFVPSRRVELQKPDAQGQWQTISVLEPGDNDYDRTAFEFAPQTLERLRIFQPAQHGPRNRPFVMWVREVKIFGVADA